MTVAAPNFWTDRKVVVLGGYGFLGSHVTAALKNRGAIPIRLSRRVGCHLEQRASAFWFLNASRPDVVINCAGNQGGIAYQQESPFQMMDENVMIGINSCAASIFYSRQYINVISSCAYPPMAGQMKEDALFSGDVEGSAAWYAFAKRVSVRYVLAARAQYGYDARTVILPNLYGPGDHFGEKRSHAMAGLIRRCYEVEEADEERITIWGTGRPVREWLYAADAAEGILNYAEVDAPCIMNIGPGVGLSISDIAHVIRDAVGSKANLFFDTTKPDGPMVKVMNVSLMRKSMEWRPRVNVDSGVKETLKWLKENYGILEEAGAL